MRAWSIAAFLSVSAIWGSEWLITRDLESPPIGALALRYAIAACLLAVVVLMRKDPLPGARDAVVSAITGITFLAAPAVLIGWATARLSPGLLVVILAMTPLLAALIEGVASGGLLVTLVGGVAGTALLASQGLSFAATQWAGVVAAVAAAGLIAGSVVCVKRSLSHDSVILLVFTQSVSAAACVGLWSLVTEGRSGFVWSWSLIRVEAALAIVGGALGLPLYYWLLKREGGQMESFQLTASQWVVTIVGVCEGLALVHERPGWRLVTGAGILLASLVALLRTQPKGEKAVTLGLTLPPDG